MAIFELWQYCIQWEI